MVDHARVARAASVVLTGAVCLMLAGPPTAWAKGPGLRTESLIVHPSFDVGGGYDSNFWRESAQENSAPVNGVAIFRTGAGLSLANRANRRIGFELDTTAGLRMATSSTADQTSSTLDNELSFDTFRTRLGLSFMKRSPVTLDIEARAKYTERPAAESLREDGYQQLEVHFGPDIRFRPGANPDSRALELRLGYRFALQRYVCDFFVCEGDDELAAYEALGANRGQSNTHKLKLMTRWQFFPKTALLLDVQYWVVDYPRVFDLDARGEQVRAPDKDASPLRAELGLKGLITPRISMTLQGGYVNSFNASGESYEGPIGRFNLEYWLEPVLRIKLSYQLKLGDDGFANFFVLHRSAFSTTVNLPSRISMTGEVGFDYYAYSLEGIPSWAAGLQQRKEPILRVKLQFGWAPTDWFGVHGSYEVEDNNSAFAYCLGEQPGFCAESAYDRVEYTRHVVMLRLATNY
jgi:hypothetical protein